MPSGARSPFVPEDRRFGCNSAKHQSFFVDRRRLVSVTRERNISSVWLKIHLYCLVWNFRNQSVNYHTKALKVQRQRCYQKLPLDSSVSRGFNLIAKCGDTSPLISQLGPNK